MGHTWDRARRWGVSPWGRACGEQGPRGGRAYHAVGVAAVVVHAVLHQLLLVQIAGTTVRASKGGPVGDGAGPGQGVSGAAPLPTAQPARPPPHRGPCCGGAPALLCTFHQELPSSNSQSLLPRRGCAPRVVSVRPQPKDCAPHWGLTGGLGQALLGPLLQGLRPSTGGPAALPPPQGGATLPTL